MKRKPTLVAGITLWVLLAGGTVFLLVADNDFFRQGFNMAAAGVLVVLLLLLAMSVGIGYYGLGTLRHAGLLVDHHRMLANEVQVKNMVLEKKVQELTAELSQTVAQLNQEMERHRRLAEQLKTQTTTDAITGLLNRGTGMALLVNQLHISERCQWPLTIWSINIDNLKQVNDRYGHEDGDQMVREVSRIIQDNIRKSDTLFRRGDDELMVILPQCSLQEAYVIRDRIITVCQLDQRLRQYEWKVSLSHGMAEYLPGCKVRVTDFVQQASLDARRRNILT